MRKCFILLFCLLIGATAMAQNKIQLRSADRAECVKSDMTSLKASFSFSTIEAEDMATKGGEFSWLSMPNTVIGGNEGDPQIPVVNELIAVPFGANPTIRVTSFSSTDYQLSELGVKTLIPRQPSLRKDKTYEDAPFIKNEASYQTRGLRGEPTAVVQVMGTMRGVQLGKMTIEPVSYDPVNNTLRVFNDIEVEVRFDGADAKATEDMLVQTYSPYFNGIYNMLFNGKSIKDAYSAHPDLYATPVKMLVVTTSTYANSDAFNTWKTWKIQKGIDVDVLTVAANATASTIKTQIYSKYNSNHPSFLVIVGDETVVTYYQLWDYESTYGNAATDLEYASVDGDVYHDMFLSRIPVSSTTELSNYVNKALTYEKYTMSDPSYLSNVLLIAGADDTWAPKVGRPTINYAANNYFNTSNGFTNVYKYVTSTYTGCYDYLNSGVGFVNYTAHGDIQKWYSPELTNTNVNALTNNDKYFWAMGNCCLTCNFKNAQNSQTCFGETMIRAANKAAFGYIGSVPESYWYEDYYFGVGATSTMSTTPSMSQTTTGVYDFMFDDTQMNTLNAVPFAGNVAVTYAHANSYTSSVTDEYYWRAYQCFGDGSIMPYHTQPAANNVTHASTISIGAATFTVNADAGSYVAITKDNVILGVKEVPSSGTVNVPISGLTSAGDVMIVVTRQQRQPYITTIQAISNDGPYISLDSYTPNTALIGEATNLSLTFKNVGNSATSGNTTVTLTSSDATFSGNNKTFGTLAANATTTVSGFTFTLNNGVTLGSPVTFHYTATNGSNTWEGNFGITPNQIFTVNVSANNNDYGTVSGGGQYNYNESCTVTATPADGYMFTSWTNNGTIVSTNPSYTFNVTANTNLTANFASGVMIGDGGTTTNDYLPSYNYYNYSLSEQIYTSAELGGAGIITSIAFYNGGSAKTRTYDFYMKATTKSSFSGATDWITVSASDKVYSGSVTMVAGDWTTITFSTPFVYDGTSNVVLVADDNTGTYTSSPHMSCRVFATTSNQALYAYNDNTNFNPLSPPTSSSTNNAVLSSKNQIVLTKEAVPTESFNITVSVNPTEAGTASGGGEYQYGETCTVSVRANEGYTFAGWTENGNVVSTDLSFSFTVTTERNLVANFIQAIEIGEGTTTHNYLPTYNYYNYSMTEQIYTVDEIGMAGTISSIAFYNEGAEKTRTLDFYLKATTKDAFSSKTDWVTVSASEKVFSGSVTFTANTWTFVNFTTPFEYDGASNIVLVVDDNSGAYTQSPHLACSVFNTSSTQAIYIYSDGTNYNPASPTTSQSSNYATLSVKNHIMMGIEASGTPHYTINVTANPTNGGTVSGGGTFEPDETCTLTAIANEHYTFTNWTNNGNIVSTDATYSFPVTASGAYVANFTAVPQYTITIAPDDVEHGTVAFGSKNRDDLAFDFEDGWQGWTTFQGSTSSPHSWMHNTEYTAYDSNSNQIVPECHNSSSGMMLSESYISASTSGGSGTAVTPDNYLVSPRFSLGGSFKFYAASRMSNYPAEKFSVLVSTSGNTSASDFTHTELTVTLSDNSWNEYTIDLSAYSGMGYVAIRHYDCNDQHLLYIDDVTITEPTVDDGSLSRTFYQGESCTVVATPNTDYHFANWTENGTEASTLDSYTFTVTGDRNLVANFTQQLPTYTINVTATDGGTVTGGGTFEQGQSCTVIATPSEGYMFTNWTENDTEASNQATYTFTVNGNRDLVANFTLIPVENTYTLTQGWNWWSANQEITLEQLENAIVAYTTCIVSQHGTVDYMEGYGWEGDFETIDLAEMYKLCLPETVEIPLTAAAADPANHPITITKGKSNWIGYPVQESMSVKNAMAGLTKTVGDRVRSNKGFTTWLGSSWSGTLKNLEPGHGYIYVAKGTGTETFTYPTGATKTVENNEAVSTAWTAQRERFASGMDLLAIVEIDGVEQTSDELEIGAFVDNECRGAVKLMYVEELGKHIAFLTVSGNNGETVSFKALQNGNVIDLQETVTLQLDQLLGEVQAPFVLHAGSNVISLFPNPANKGEHVQMATNTDLNGATVEIYNALGALVRIETLSQSTKELEGLQASGVYTVKVTDQKGNVQFGKLIVR